MPLTSMVASLVCVVAALVMHRTAQRPASRTAHAVMLGVMVVLGLGMQSLLVTTCCAVALAATAGLLVRAKADDEAATCALDVAVCAALVALMGASKVTWRTEPSVRGMDMAGLHAAGDPLLSAVLLGTTLLLIAGWALRRQPQPATRANGAAAWFMVLAMLTMVST